MGNKIKQGFARLLKKQKRIEPTIEKLSTFYNLRDRNGTFEDFRSIPATSYFNGGYSIAKRNGENECARRRKQLENRTCIQLSLPTGNE